MKIFYKITSVITFTTGATVDLKRKTTDPNFSLIVKLARHAQDASGDLWKARKTVGIEVKWLKRPS